MHYLTSFIVTQTKPRYQLSAPARPKLLPAPPGPVALLPDPERERLRARLFDLMPQTRRAAFTMHGEGLCLGPRGRHFTLRPGLASMQLLTPAGQTEIFHSVIAEDELWSIVRTTQREYVRAEWQRFLDDLSTKLATWGEPLRFWWQGHHTPYAYISKEDSMKALWQISPQMDQLVFSSAQLPIGRGMGSGWMEIYGIWGDHNRVKVVVEMMIINHNAELDRKGIEPCHATA